MPSITRRNLPFHLAALAGTAAAVPAAHAQGGAPVEGTHFVRLNTPAQVSLPPGKKIEVVEFFWYECPHCNTFEPLLHSWVKRLPADVAFRQVPVGFSVRHQIHQRLFYALEEMGQLGALHSRIFAAIHLQNRRLQTTDDIVAFVKEQKLDGDKFAATMKSFSVDAKARAARKLHEDYKIDGVPALGINGRYYTSGALAGGHAQALAVADLLIQRSRAA